MQQMFPFTRLRRLRSQSWIRDLVSEVKISPKNLIYPIFVRDPRLDAEIPGFSDIRRYCIDELDPVIKEVQDLNIPAVLLFPCIHPDDRSPYAEYGMRPDNLICQALSHVKSIAPNLGLICDVALDPYTDHGHDGIIVKNKVDNDETVRMLCQQAMHQAEAGADIISPSDMMDGRIGAIRHTLDSQGMQDKLILSYAVKYASCLYAPFRKALALKGLSILPDKKTYQMDPANKLQALAEARLDISEGADMLLVKPGMFYLDIIQTIASNSPMPVFAYHVSGEYVMLQQAIESGHLPDTVWLEMLTGFVRSGARAVITNAALKIARLCLN